MDKELELLSLKLKVKEALKSINHVLDNVEIQFQQGLFYF